MKRSIKKNSPCITKVNCASEPILKIVPLLQCTISPVNNCYKFWKNNNFKGPWQQILMSWAEGHIIICRGWKVVSFLRWQTMHSCFILVKTPKVHVLFLRKTDFKRIIPLLWCSVTNPTQHRNVYFHKAQKRVTSSTYLCMCELVRTVCVRRHVCVHKRSVTEGVQ